MGNMSPTILKVYLSLASPLLARIPLKERKLLEGIAREMLTGIDKKNIAFLTPTASKSLQTMRGLQLLHKAIGQVACCQPAVNQLLNLTFSLASPLGSLHKQGKQGASLCVCYHRKKFRG